MSTILRNPHPTSAAPSRLCRTLNVGAILAAAATCVGCGGYVVTATDGTIFQESEEMPDSISSALARSASRDLPCESNRLDVRRLDPEREYAVTGCGRRVLYRVLSPGVTTRRVELLSRSTSPTDRPES
jgi:hypothetical protein